MSNSTNTTAEICTSGSERNLLISVIYALHGTVYVVLYIPCLIVICRQPLIKDSCYKIMAAMGFMDLSALLANCFGPSILSAIGDPRCKQGAYWMHRVDGAAGMWLWVTYAMTCILLALNRMIAMFSPRLAKKLFTTGIVVTFLVMTVVFGFAIFIANMMSDAAIIYAPSIGFLTFEENSGFVQGFNEVFNYVIGITLVVIYILICAKLYQKTSVASGNAEAANLARMERSVTIQSVLMCSMTASAAWGYMILPKLDVPLWTWTLMNLLWQMLTGTNALIYLTLNQTIIRGVKKMFRKSTTTTTTHQL